MAVKRKFLGEMLIEAGIITNEQLEECLLLQKESGERIGDIIESNWTSALADSDVSEVPE